MILTVDIGNTNICIAVHPDDSPSPVFFERIHTDREKGREHYAEDLRTILELHGVAPGVIRAAALSSVVPSVKEALLHAMRSVLSCRILPVSSALSLGYGSHIEALSTVGTDILCDVSGALFLYGTPVITIDMGTATVVSFTDGTPSLSGVIINPGVRTSINALSKNTSSLPSVSLEAPGHVIGTNTVDAMGSGIIYGTASLLDGLIDRIIEETGISDCRVAATGGLSSFIVPFCRHEIAHDETLLMKGMWRILQLNPGGIAEKP